MNSHFFPLRRRQLAREIELSRRNVSREIESQTPQARSPLQNFRITRPRQHFFHRHSEVPEAVSHAIDTIPCRYCNSSISTSFYEQHLADCPVKRGLTQEDQAQSRPFDLEGSQRQQEEPNEPVITDQDNTNILPIVESGQQQQSESSFPNDSITFASEERVEDMPNLVESPILQPDRPDPHSNDPFSFFANMFNASFSNAPQENSNVENQQSLPPILEEPSLPNTTNTQEEENSNSPDSGAHSTQLENLLDNRHHGGAFVVRTIESGPNGSTIVRMRVIPLDHIFGRQDGDEPNPESAGIFGLLSMLAGLQGVNIHFGDFLNIFHEERGLDKEALDNLPVVVYTEDRFKNVDEESKKCTICLEHYEEDQEVKFLWCLHRFHKNCVDQWLDKHTNCPFCKKDYADALRSFETA